MWRWSWDGRVCSGDFLSKTERESIRQNRSKTEPSGYLIAEGNFLKGVIITIYLMIGLLIFTVVFLALFCSVKRTEAELAARKGGLFKTDIAPSYESKFVSKQDINRRPSTLGRLVEDITTE